MGKIEKYIPLMPLFVVVTFISSISPNEIVHMFAMFIAKPIKLDICNNTNVARGILLKQASI